MDKRQNCALSFPPASNEKYVLQANDFANKIIFEIWDR